MVITNFKLIKIKYGLNIVLSLLVFIGLTACSTSKNISNSVKAKRGNVNAQVELGRRYYYGEGVDKSYAKAIEYFHKAAAQGSPVAMEALARRYYHGGKGVQQNYQKAFRFASQAAANGRAGAMSMLGVMYCTGKGVTKNDKVCVQWYERAAKGGEAMTQLALARKYAVGKGTPLNLKRALFWYQKAAANNIPDAQTELCQTVQAIKKIEPGFSSYDRFCL